MKEIKTYVVLCYTTGLKSNFAEYRFLVGAKTEKEAERFAKNWLAEQNLTSRTRSPRTYYEAPNVTLKYKQVEPVKQIIRYMDGRIKYDI